MKKSTVFKWGIGLSVMACLAFFLVRFLNQKPEYDTLDEFMTDF